MAFDHCFSSEMLARFLTGACDTAAVAGITQHVEICPHCQKQLETLASDARFESRLVRHISIPTSDKRLPQRRIGQWKTIRNVAHVGSEVSGKVQLDFLEPVKDPSALGMFGNYLVLDVIGKGGMGIVLRVRDSVLHRTVAVKVLSPELALNHDFRRRFLREARAAAAVVHENVIPINKVGKHGELLFIEMQLIIGQSLQHLLQLKDSFSLEKIVRIGSDIADGLAAAHQQKLIHLDIKPANILLDKQSGRARIADFGVARLGGDSQLTSIGFALGTPEYMSPEQARGDKADYRSDLFSLGSVLYALCTGRNPFSGTVGSVLQQVEHESARPILDTHPELPVALCQIIERLHAKHPADRYPSATGVRQALQAVVVQDLRKDISQEHKTGLPMGLLVSILGGTLTLLAVILYVLWENGSVVSSGDTHPMTVVSPHISPTTPNTPAIQCLHEDGSWQSMENLEAALHNCRTGDIIELGSNGPFPCGTVKIHDKRVVIRAAVGTRPVIIIKASAAARDAWMDLYDADVTLEGLTIHGGSGHANTSRHKNRVLFCNHSHLQITHTRIELPQQHPIIAAAGTSNIQLLSSELLSGNGPNLEWEVSHDGMLDITQCLLTGSIGCVIHMDHPFNAKATVRLANSTLVGYQAFAVVLHPDRHRNIVLPMVLFRNVFDTQGAVLLVDGMGSFTRHPSPTELRQLLARAIALTDQENIYSADMSLVFASAFGPHQGREIGADRLVDWNALWSLAENRSLVLQGGLGLNGEAMHQLDPTDYQLPESWQEVLAARQLTGRIGVDPKTIGPGPAYHAWRLSQRDFDGKNK